MQQASGRYLQAHHLGWLYTDSTDKKQRQLIISNTSALTSNEADAILDDLSAYDKWDRFPICR